MSTAVKNIYISTGYQPRPLQGKLHAYLKRFNVIVCHRRWGKTVFSVNEMLDRALRCELEHPQYAYIAPTYMQAERVAWAMLQKYTKDIPGVEYNQQKLTCKIPRPHRGDFIKIMLLGAENYDSIRGIYLDGAILDEFATMDPQAWSKVVRPALSDRIGWCIFIGTPAGQNHLYDAYLTALKNPDTWYACIHKASTSGVIPPEELAAMRAEMTENEYEQEMECSFTAAIVGAYYAKYLVQAEKDKRIGIVSHDPSLLVDTAWDLGVSDTTTIWFVQQFRQEIRIIDYIEQSGEGLPYYVKALRDKHRAAYNYRDHHWPHDGGSRDLSTGKERSTTMRDLGVRVKVHPRHTPADGIDAVRRLIPRCHFDAVKCERGLSALKNYQQKWDSKNKIFLDQPLHNWASHGADGFRQLAMSLRPGDDRLADKRNLPRRAETEYDLFNM